jgi:hypothetical protein
MGYPPRPVGSGPRLASIGSGRQMRRTVLLLRRREREGYERNRDRAAVTPASDDRCAVGDADEPGPSASMHHRLIRLKSAAPAELQLQEFRAGDRVQAERVHTPKVRQDSRSSSRRLRPDARRAFRGSRVQAARLPQMASSNYPRHGHTSSLKGLRRGSRDPQCDHWLEFLVYLRPRRRLGDRPAAQRETTLR